MNLNKIFWIVAGALIMLTAYQIINSRQNLLKTALNMAEENREELEKTLEHYKKVDKDKEKLEAAEFLISNCIIHGSVNYTVRDFTGKIINYNPSDYPDYNAAREVKASISSRARVSSETVYDIKALKSDYLINHIDYSFKVWRNSPWKRDVDFDRFCNYILPYRAKSEPLSYWIEELHDKYSHVLDTLSNNDILSACKALNLAIAEDMKYDRRWVAGRICSQDIPDMLENKGGSCDDITIYGMCVMRSFGIPVSSDFDIHGRADNGHTWCVVYDEKGKSHSFGAGEQQPEEHKYIFTEYKHRALAKVFRNSFALRNSGLVNKVKNLDEIPAFFRARNISDVTAEYVEAIDVEYTLELKLSQDDKYLYLCIYNNDRWKPLQWSKIKDNKAVFPNMGPEILYIVGAYSYNNVNPISSPFILNPDGSITKLSNSGEKLTIDFEYRGGIYKHYPIKGKKLILNSWTNGHWDFEQDFTAVEDSILHISNLRKDALYKFQDGRRPFIVNDSIIEY